MLPGVSPDFTPQLDGFFDLTHRGSHWRSAGCQTLGPPCFVLHLCCVGVGDKIPPWVIRIDGLNDVFVFNGLFMYLNITFETETVKENWFLAMWKHDISWFGEESVWFLDFRRFCFRLYKHQLGGGSGRKCCRLGSWQLALAMVADSVDRVFNGNHWMSIKKMHGYLGNDQNMHLKWIVPKLYRRVTETEYRFIACVDKSKGISQRIHGTGIFPYICHKNQPNVGI